MKQENFIDKQIESVHVHLVLRTQVFQKKWNTDSKQRLDFSHLASTCYNSDHCQNDVIKEGTIGDQNNKFNTRCPSLPWGGIKNKHFKG